MVDFPLPVEPTTTARIGASHRRAWEGDTPYRPQHLGAGRPITRLRGCRELEAGAIESRGEVMESGA